MNRRLVIVTLLLVTLFGMVTNGVTSAQSESPMTEEKIEQIKKNCVAAQSTLNQLHATDGQLRVNRGPLYELISTKLMAPLNSRIALNRLEGLELTATALEYDRKRGDFRTSYKAYEETMSQTLNISCVDQPVAFYDSLQDARTKRQKVNEDIKALNGLLETYRVNFETFASKRKGSS